MEKGYEGRTIRNVLVGGALMGALAMGGCMQKFKTCAAIPLAPIDLMIRFIDSEDRGIGMLEHFQEGYDSSSNDPYDPNERVQCKGR
jgi:hypothetical protein